jgi:hypothetical protein
MANHPNRGDKKRRTKLTADEALRLTLMQYRNTGGGDDQTWIKFLDTMHKRSLTDPQEIWLPMLKGLTADFGQWVYADCEAQEVVVVYHRLSPFGTGLNRKIGLHSFRDLREIQNREQC